MKDLVTGILAHVDGASTHLSEGCSTAAAQLKRWAGWITGMPFWTRIRWSGSGASRSFQAGGPALGGEAAHPDGHPGHVDFSAEMERSLQVLDYAILVISGTDGVQAHTETLWHLLGALSGAHVPFYQQNGSARGGANGSSEGFEKSGLAMPVFPLTPEARRRTRSWPCAPRS